MHHSSLMRRDDAYRMRYNALLEAEQERQRAEIAAAEQRLEAIRQAERRQKQQRVGRLLESAPSAPLIKIVRYASRSMTLWIENTIPGYSIPKAYVAIMMKSPRHEAFPALIQAVLGIVLQGFGYHPDHERYSDVPNEERQAALQRLEHALEMYGNMNDYMNLLPQTDQFRAAITARQHAEEVARLEQERAARHAQMNAALRERAVVFQRDPEGGIDLRAFATDNQNVHRSSVQENTQRVIHILLGRSVPDDQDTLTEIIVDFNDGSKIRWRNDIVRNNVLHELTNDYVEAVAFNVRYKDVLDRVWTYIRAHTERRQLVRILAHEVADGRNMCVNGKMARLINVLQGYDETLSITELPREVFQNAIAALMGRPLEERERAAQVLFEAHGIPENERGAWLEPLLEAA